MKENFEDREKKENEAAWYEKRSESTAWFETGRETEKEENTVSVSSEETPVRENSASASKEEKNNGEHTLSDLLKETNGENSVFAPWEETDDQTDDGENASAFWPADDRREEGEKIYLPDPPPPFAADKIADERAYIDKNFETNAVVARVRREKTSSKMSKAMGLFLAVACFAGGLCMFFASQAVLGLFLLAMGAVLAVMTAYLRRNGRDHVKKASKFFLIKPYAAEAEFDPLANTSAEREEEPHYGLKLYYIDNGRSAALIEHQASTDFIYTKAQIDELITAFLAGKLIAACRRGVFSETAVICAPAYTLPDDPHF